MKFSKKLLLTQVVALAACSTAFADSKPSKISDYIASGNPVLAPMVSSSVNGFGVNNELFLLSQKQNGALKDGLVYINGRLNVAADWNHLSQENNKTGKHKSLTGALENNSSVLNPGFDLAITSTKGWFTAFADLSTNLEASAFSIVNLGQHVNTGGILQPNGHRIGLYQGYLMLGDLSKMPVYFLAGRKTVDFGSFANQEQTWQPLTNLFRQGTQNQLSVGFYDFGLHGAVSLFRAPWSLGTGGSGKPNVLTSAYHSNNLSTAVATLSYGTTVNKFGFNAGMSYTSNLNPSAGILYGAQGNSGLIPTHERVDNRVSGGIIFAEVNFNPITVTGNYASAMKTVNNINQNGKPNAWDVGARFDFNLMNHANWLSGNYSSLNLKRANQLKSTQWLFGWNMALSNNMNATLQYGHQKDKDTNTTITTNFIALQGNVYF